MRKLLVIKRKGKLKMKSKSVLQLQYESRDTKTVIREYSVRDLDGVLVIGRELYIESSVLTILATLNIPVAIIAKGSLGIVINPVITVTNYYRARQYQLSRVEMLNVALRYLVSKVAGMINILKYYGSVSLEVPPPPSLVGDLNEYEYEIRKWESISSNILWDKVIELIKAEYFKELKEKYGLSGRRPKHPDPFNKALSVMYAVLYSLATKALLAAGLDPTYGFLHRTMYSTPLTFDYVEQFKPVAIQATIDMINKTGLPQIAEDGELTRESVNESIKWLYSYLTLKHTKTRKTIYQYIFLKAYCLAKYLEGKCLENKLAIVWDRRSYT